eukprot:402185-Rhodomonas_salina.1
MAVILSPCSFGGEMVLCGPKGVVALRVDECEEASCTARSSSDPENSNRPMGSSLRACENDGKS